MSLRTAIAFGVGVLTAALLLVAADVTTRLIGLVCILAVLAYLAVTLEGARHEVRDLGRLRTSFEQLDQQAKLVIRTDLELHRTQEELDQRVGSLMALHDLSRQLQVSLRAEEIYSRLDARTVAGFGFSKGLLGRCATPDALTWDALVGLPEDTADQLRRHLLESGLLQETLGHPAPQVIEEATATAPAHRTLLELLQVPRAVLAGVLPHAGPPGCLLLGQSVVRPATARADRELIGVLTNAIATAVENSALYEQAFDAKQELERKVRDRTHELASANAELQRLNNAKSSFVSAVSHELRTPLAAIKGYAALLTSGQFGKLSAAQAERIAKVEKHADALTQLINNLLDIARIESGRVTMDSRAFPVEEFFSNVQDLVRPQLEAKRITFAAELDGVRQLYGDAQQLQRVFVNLLSNAIKYTPAGGAVRLNLQRETQGVVAAVSDTGCGIADEHLPKLFTEFFRVADAANQQVPGTGLGLALVKRIVEAHHGAITVESAVGRGSTFTVRLPAPRDGGPQAGPPAGPQVGG